MNTLRREWLKTTTAAALAVGLMRSGTAQAIELRREAFANLDFDAAMNAIGGIKAVVSGGISITAPDLSEHGAMVPIEVISRIPNTESIAIVVEKNAIPVVAKFDFQNGAEGYVATRIKMAESSQVHAVVRAGGHIYKASKSVAVTIGGCESYPSPMKSVNER